MIEIVPLKSNFYITTTVPASKSYTNRALLLAALSDGKCILSNPLLSDDTKVMIHSLRELGIKITSDHDKLIVQGNNGLFKKPVRPIFLGNAGTAVRFLTAALALQNFQTVVTGDKRMQERPVKDLVDALKKMCVIIEAVNHCPPITIHGPVKNNTTEVNGDISSQYLSALLMIAPLTGKEVTINVKGHLTSLPYIKMTLQTMKTFGVEIKNTSNKTFNCRPQIYKATNYQIEGDASSATYPLAIAALNQGIINISNIPQDSLQADLKFLDIMRKMGCRISKKSGIKLETPKTKAASTADLKPLGEIDLNDLPDAAMTVAAVCGLVHGTSILKNIGNLRVKECDRLHALATELRKIGVKLEEGPDFLAIHGDPSKLRGAVIETYNDHRMAMCFAVIGTKIDGIKIKNPECVSKTYPTFWEDLQKWGIEIKND